jgi:2-phospho-L-lactate transferase/gluconeogenesis factor (CofD/UPF0052 family)
MKVVLFCGGRGSATIIRALLRQPGIELTLLVNAYDDGQSTGALRSFIPGMLGPSDFRKNLSWLLSDASNAPYASLMEYRFPASTGMAEIETLARFTRSNDPDLLEPPLKDWFAQLPPALSARLRALLGRFFDHAVGTAFDYRDCSLGNLVFAGAYLVQGNDFNAAVAEVSGLVGSWAHLLNVAESQNRVLVGLKADGTLLASEAEIVGPQSPVPISDLYLLKQPLTEQDRRELAARDTEGKRAFLAARNDTPRLSPEASQALGQADVILYGPGTQHSSLLPSYRIAARALAASPARVKALVVNLDNDHDIQGLSAGDIVDRVIAYGAPVTDILVDENARLPAPHGNSHHGARVVRSAFAQAANPGQHDGDAVLRYLMTA